MPRALRNVQAWLIFAMFIFMSCRYLSNISTASLRWCKTELSAWSTLTAFCPSAIYIRYLQHRTVVGVVKVAKLLLEVTTIRPIQRNFVHALCRCTGCITITYKNSYFVKRLCDPSYKDVIFLNSQAPLFLRCYLSNSISVNVLTCRFDRRTITAGRNVTEMGLEKEGNG